MPVSVTCPGCGSAVPVGDRFCGTCGNPISGSALLSGEGARFDPWLELLQKLRAATLGEYEIRGELGRGGMAAVFLAQDLQLNRRVAIKVMLPGLTYGERMWDRFLAEARTAAKLDHPHIVYIHSVKEKDRFLYFVMKHIDGCSLDDLLAEHKAFPIPVAQTILAEVARALDYAHREGVVHRDIKPANIMVDRKGSSIVMDFGIARVVDTQHFTQTGATIGTPAYMSPEQCHGSETSAASDQYSLGVLAYELLTGAPPFTGTPIELQIAHMQDAPASIRDKRPELSLELSGAVTRMLAKDPAARWPSLHDTVPIFSRGLDALDDAPRTRLMEMVRTASPRRKSFPATPISPAPRTSSAQGAITPYHSRESSATIPASDVDVDAGVGNASGHDARTEISRPLASMPAPGEAVVPDEDISAPPAADNAPWAGGDMAPPSGAGWVDPAPAGEISHANDAAGLNQPRGGSAMSARAATLVSIGVVAVIAGAVLLRGGKKPAPPVPRPAAPVATVVAPPPAPPVASVKLPGDSVAMGLGAPLKPLAAHKAPIQVTPDAVALLMLTLPKARATVGDTMHVRLDAMDDAGRPVTTSQIYWSTSNAAVVRFAGPARLIAVKEGKATITVTAGSSTTAKEVTVVGKKR